MKLAIILLIVVVGVYAVNASYPNFLCPSEKSDKTFYSCNDDCMHQHGAIGGKCSGNLRNLDYNCYCGPQNVRHVYEKSLMCREKTDKYRNVCSVDCQCNHAAKGGYCNWERKACICEGEDLTNSACPAENPQDFAKYIVSQVGIEGLGDMGAALVAPLFKH